jgi:glycosyltransferase involved in cell wall biosynthesis
MKKIINLSLVLSFRNEEQSINEFYHSLKYLLDINKIIYEFIFVDDDSNDNSKQKILDLINVDKSIKYIRFSRNFGVGPAIIAGLEHSVGESTIYMDCDLQEPPELVIQMYNKFKNEGYDVVHTKRILRLGESKFKLFLTFYAYKILELFCRPKIIINSGDFRLLSQKAKLNVLNLKERNPFIRALSIWIGFKQVIIEYNRLPRKYGTTHFSLLSSVNPYKELIRGITSFSSLPLYFSFLFFLLCFLISFLLIFFDIPIIYIICFFLFSLVFLCFGILSMYIERILEQTNSRPIYLIDEKIGFD